MINNLFPTPIYSNTIDSDTLKKLQTDINDYIKNNEDGTLKSSVDKFYSSDDLKKIANENNSNPSD